MENDEYENKQEQDRAGQDKEEVESGKPESKYHDMIIINNSSPTCC